MSIGQGIQGAAGGALAGGGFGGPVGAAIGGGLGLLGGLFGGGGGDRYRQMLEQMTQGGYHQAGPAAQGGYSSFRGNQQNLIGMLEAMARGQGPSLAAMQMREGMDRAAGSQNALAAGAAGRGASPGGAYLNAANQTAAIQSQGARDTAQARVGEQLGALNQLGLATYGARGQDEETNRFNAGQQNQMSMANLQAMMQTDAGRAQILQMLAGSSGPGMGTQILAGGAGMFPYLSGQNAAGQGGAAHGPGGGNDWWHGAPQMYAPPPA